MPAYTSACTQTYIHIHACTHTHTCIRARTHTHTHIEAVKVHICSWLVRVLWTLVKTTKVYYFSQVPLLKLPSAQMHHHSTGALFGGWCLSGCCSKVTCSSDYNCSHCADPDVAQSASSVVLCSMTGASAALIIVPRRFRHLQQPALLMWAWIALKNDHSCSELQSFSAASLLPWACGIFSSHHSRWISCVIWNQCLASDCCHPSPARPRLPASASSQAAGWHIGKMFSWFTPQSHQLLLPLLLELSSCWLLLLLL